MVLVTGIDEAGRSQILGPIFFAGVTLDEGVTERLVKSGLKDSKLCTRRQILDLYERIMKFAESVRTIDVQPRVIDAWIENKEKHDPALSRGLNALEAYAAAKLIEELDGERYYVDSPDQNTKRFRDTILRYCSKDLTQDDVIAEVHADENRPVVSAASIIAYHRRKIWSKGFEEEYGLSPDVLWITPRLESVIHRIPPAVIRRSWRSWRKFKTSKTRNFWRSIDYQT